MGPNTVTKSSYTKVATESLIALINSKTIHFNTALRNARKFHTDLCQFQI
jgi:hypothetical protein